MNTKLVLLGAYFILTPFFILALIFYQTFLYHQQSHNVGVLGASTSKVEYRSLPPAPADTTISFSVREARVDVLKEFFTRYNSPLLDYTENIVDAADKYHLDYRLLPAIAMQESTLCLKAPKGTNNCWGFGIYGKKRTAFDNLADAIETVSKTLAEDYNGNGLIEPAQIMTKYTPSSNGSWATGVSYVMDRIGAAL